MRINPAYVFSAERIGEFKWPARTVMLFPLMPVSAALIDGTELVGILERHFQYLPFKHVQLYVRHGLIAGLLFEGMMDDINQQIVSAYYRDGNTGTCPCLLRIKPTFRPVSSVQKEIIKREYVGDGISVSAIKRALRMELAPGSHTATEWRKVMQRDGWKCLRCGELRNLSKDHVVPISRGGSNSADNLQTLCRSCNSWKGAKHIDFRVPATATVRTDL